MEQIIEEPILAVPHFVVILSDWIHGVRDPDKMFEEAECNILIHRIVVGQDQCNFQHVLAIEGHPRRAVGLIKMTTGWKLSAAIEYPNVVESKKPARENVLSLRIFPVDPPVEIQHQALKRTLQKAEIRAAQFLFHVVEE